jgi:hypothetical protein
MAVGGSWLIEVEIFEQHSAMPTLQRESLQGVRYHNCKSLP